MSEPLTPEEEAHLRATVDDLAAFPTHALWANDVGRLLATLDRARATALLAEAALTPTGDHHTLPDGYCLDCSGGCIVPLARENTEALRKAAYAKPDPFAVKDGAR